MVRTIHEKREQRNNTKECVSPCNIQQRAGVKLYMRYLDKVHECMVSY